MSSLVNPVGPERRGVYWRRRLVALVVLALVLALLVAGVVAGVRALTGTEDSQAAERLDPARTQPTLTPAGDPSGSPTAGTGQSPTASPTGEPTDGATDGAGEAPVQPCAPAGLAVSLTSSAVSFGPQESPRINLVVQNTGDAPCTAEIGSATRTFSISDAAGAQVWSSADCEGETGSQVYELAPAGAEGSTRAMGMTWSRQHSAPGCSGDQPRAEAGQYSATATWDGVSATPLSFTLLD
ncbi:hypothetical protein [Kineococcus sp. SYSU DK004]|uniref:hypothetical protein n=1 Tax=Kineococcus sp. SYSU DK004 TaxID=3383125 RepID=UPI003D7DC0B8